MESSRSDRVASVVTATVVHSTMVGGLLLGRWDAGASVVGVLLDILLAYVAWLAVYLRLRPTVGVYEVLGKTFVGLSLSVWGFIAMFRAITLKDTALLAFNAALLDGLGNLGSLDGDAAGVILLIVALVLLTVSLYFLGKILVVMSIVDLGWLFGGVALFRIVDLLRYLHRHKESSRIEKIADAEEHLTELCLHVFVKGWAGAFIMFVLVGLPCQLVWIYLAWSYTYDVVVRRWLWNKFGGRVQHRVLARAASRVRASAPA